MFVRSLQKKNRKRLVRVVLDSSATYSRLVHGVTDTYCWAQNGSTHGRIFAPSKVDLKKIINK